MDLKVKPDHSWISWWLLSTIHQNLDRLEDNVPKLKNKHTNIFFLLAEISCLKKTVSRNIHIRWFSDRKKTRTIICLKRWKCVILQPTWKQIEPRALALGESRLHRIFQRQDLFARDARFHPSCHLKILELFMTYREIIASIYIWNWSRLYSEGTHKSTGCGIRFHLRKCHQPRKNCFFSGTSYFQTQIKE